MRLDQRLVDAAIELAESRWPTGESGAAAMYTEDGRILTSVAVDAHAEAALLCHETGAICEAHKLDVPITASVCVGRRSEDDPFAILAACGLCQERLAFWGGDAEVAVPDPDEPTEWRAKRLRELQPYYWYKAYDPSWGA